MSLRHLVSPLASLSLLVLAAGCPATTTPTDAGGTINLCANVTCGKNELCIQGTCSCAPGNHQCAWGCEPVNSVTACGADCLACPTPPANGQAFCANGRCGLACDAGFHVCGPACADNGSPSTCGASCAACEVFLNAAGATCLGGRCGLSCPAGWGDCDGRTDSGCETELATPSNCGACGRDCGAADCIDGVCGPLPVATGLGDVRPGLAQDSDGLYVTIGHWADGGGAVLLLPRDGSPAVPLAVDQDAPWGVASDSVFVYWTNEATGRADAGAVLRVAKAGGSPQVLADGQDAPRGVAVLGTLLGWVSAGTGAKDGRLTQSRVDGGSRVVLSTGLDGPEGLALVPSYALWTAPAAGLLARTGLGTGGTQVLVDGGAAALAVSGSVVAFSDDRHGQVLRVDWRGADASVVAASPATPGPVAFDGREVFWLAGDGVYRAGLDGGVAVRLATGQSGGAALIIDDTWVTWSRTGGGGGVWRLHR